MLSNLALRQSKTAAVFTEAEQLNGRNTTKEKLDRQAWSQTDRQHDGPGEEQVDIPYSQNQIWSLFHVWYAVKVTDVITYTYTTYTDQMVIIWKLNIFTYYAPPCINTFSLHCVKGKILFVWQIFYLLSVLSYHPILQLLTVHTFCIASATSKSNTSTKKFHQFHVSLFSRCLSGFHCFHCCTPVKL